jgi:hypothetical protein
LTCCLKKSPPLHSAEIAPPAPEQNAQAVILGTVKYPWGVVKDARISAGDRTTVSDSNGNYELSGLSLGSYSVVVQAPFPGYEAPPQLVELVAGDVKTLDIYLDFIKAIVGGHVYSRDGTPISGATLSGVLSGKDMGSSTTDSEGFFRLGKVTPGDRFIRVNAPGFVGETRDFKAVQNQSTTLDFHLTPASCKISGIVRATDGKPLSGEILLLKQGVVVQKAISNAETGYYEFPAVPDRYEVLPVVSGYTPSGWSGAVTADIRADFTLNPVVALGKQEQ